MLKIETLMSHLKFILLNHPPPNCLHIFFQNNCITFASIWANLNTTHNSSLFNIAFLSIPFLKEGTSLKAFQCFLEMLSFSSKILKNKIDGNSWCKNNHRRIAIKSGQRCKSEGSSHKIIEIRFD
jgi:uncharacterized protein YlaI